MLGHCTQKTAGSTPNDRGARREHLRLGDPAARYLAQVDGRRDGSLPRPLTRTRAAAVDLDRSGRASLREVTVGSASPAGGLAQRDRRSAAGVPAWQDDLTKPRLDCHASVIAGESTSGFKSLSDRRLLNNRARVGMLSSHFTSRRLLVDRAVRPERVESEGKRHVV